MSVNYECLYYNMDKKDEIKKGARTTTDPSMEGLIKALYNAMSETGGLDGVVKDEQEMADFICNSGEYNDGCLNLMEAFLELLYTGKTGEDLEKYEISYDNVYFGNGHLFGPLIGAVSGYMGLHTLKSGLAVLQCISWDSFFFVMYFDGKDLRAYVPTYGNAYNTDLNKALERCNADEYMAFEEKQMDYRMKHGLSTDLNALSFINIDAVLEDVQETIQIID